MRTCVFNRNQISSKALSRWVVSNLGILNVFRFGANSFGWSIRLVLPKIKCAFQSSSCLFVFVKRNASIRISILSCSIEINTRSIKFSRAVNAPLAWRSLRIRCIIVHIEFRTIKTTPIIKHSHHIL